MHKQKETHLQVALKIVQYLSGALGREILSRIIRLILKHILMLII